ncbi:BlaI/MecI/CopY family transcriptional regulator [Sphingomonas morindae]|uniref:BlaI/MecI/CopY family transcriptional regulator n=1 Tax=Sphingomonas morindae TaxID=1541170 RepID=A0ABY4X7J2_9SPHN|nr:BlaI/MecI/CopY family transcriptional regulator [Sphingomonas morindae]USI72605.1 BlaI/MecI/CopY family transcriptional regulator [Sphingomonas morindae]
MVERIGEGELAVMEVLWDTAPLSAAEVVARLGPDRDWSDSTVKTMLARLVAKGALAHEEDGRRYRYRPMLARDAYARTETRRLADRLFGGRAAPLVAHLAEAQTLSEEDIAELDALVQALRK